MRHIKFGDSCTLADELSSLILKGTKTATCSALWEWEAEGIQLPEIGTKTIVLDGNGNPTCIIETTEIMICSFNEVDAQFAYEEGENDRSFITHKLRLRDSCQGGLRRC